MKRSMILSFSLAMFAPIALIGCGEEARTESKTKVETPTGSSEKTVTEKEKTTGDMKPDAPK